MLLDPAADFAPPHAGQLLCAGCGDRAWCLRPSRTKWPVAPLLTEKHNGFGTFSFKILSGALGGSGRLLGPSWVTPECPLGAPGCLLGASWMPPGCLSNNEYQNYLYIHEHTWKYIVLGLKNHFKAALGQGSARSSNPSGRSLASRPWLSDMDSLLSTASNVALGPAAPPAV